MFVGTRSPQIMDQAIDHEKIRVDPDISREHTASKMSSIEPGMITRKKTLNVESNMNIQDHNLESFVSADDMSQGAILQGQVTGAPLKIVDGNKRRGSL